MRCDIDYIIYVFFYVRIRFNLVLNSFGIFFFLVVVWLNNVIVDYYFVGFELRIKRNII